MRVLVRPARRVDIAPVVRLHRSAFPGQLTTTLGTEVIRDYYSSAFDPGSTMQLRVAEYDGEVAGFAATLMHPERFYAGYRRRRFKILALAMPSLIRSPRAVREVVGAYLRARDSAVAHSCGVELSSIAVHPHLRGRGVGSRLVANIRETASPNTERIYLWTDAHDNDVTLAFYRRLGFQQERERSFDGRRRLLCLALELDTRADSKEALP
jgi:ribosomal protein S18 acetylase RimI-like enzyme